MFPAFEEQYLHIFTTHMQASYNENDGKMNDVNDRMRLRQVPPLSSIWHCLSSFDVTLLS